MLHERAPPKVTRFLVSVSATKENREDILIAFDEMFDRTADEFGVTYAYLYAYGHALRSIPFGVVAWAMKIIGFFVKMVI